MDRALTRAGMAEPRSISTRAVITSTSFTNHYEWGNLKANPLKLLEKYFDAFVYVANWGIREFYLRLPQELVDYKQLRTMLPGDAASVRKAGRHVIVGFENESEQNDWDDGTGWMGTLMSLRSELLHGDLRCLYLGWLLCVQLKEFAGEELEPPVPAGLGELSAPLHSLIEFLGIDEDLVEVAALTSAPLNAGPSRKEVDAWIRSLPEKEKIDLLVTAASQSGDRWRNKLLRRFRQQKEPQLPPIPSGRTTYSRADPGSCECARGGENPAVGRKASGGRKAAESKSRGRPQTVSGPIGEAPRNDLESDRGAHPETPAERIRQGGQLAGRPP